MRSGLVLAIVLILVAASLGTGYDFGNSTRGTETVTSTTVSATTLTEVSTATAATTVTTTISPVTTTTSTSCTATGGIGCPHFFNTNWTISVSYTGPWGASYQGWLGDQSTGQLVVSGSFYGNSSGSKIINVAGTSDYGITVCAEAQKLDSSGSTLVVSILPPNVTNQTSVAYGTATTCVADVIQ